MTRAIIAILLLSALVIGLALRNGHQPEPAKPAAPQVIERVVTRVVVKKYIVREPVHEVPAPRMPPRPSSHPPPGASGGTSALPVDEVSEAREMPPPQAGSPGVINHVFVPPPPPPLIVPVFPTNIYSRVVISGMANGVGKILEGEVVDGSFSLNAPGLSSAGRIPASAFVSIPVRSLHSDWGGAFANRLYEQVFEVRRGVEYGLIRFALEELTVAESLTGNLSALCTAKGLLSAHGRTNHVDLPRHH